MRPDALWEEAYRAAMLEADQSKLGQRIDAAQAALQERIKELKLAGEHNDSSEERQLISEALESLRMLRKLEIKPRSDGNRRDGEPPDGGSNET